MQSDHDKEVLQINIDNLPSGVTMFDGEQRMVASNRLLRRLLEFPDELFEPNLPTLYDLALFNARRGEYGPGHAKAIACALATSACF